MATVPKPPMRRGKGLPPTGAEPQGVVSNNTERPEEGQEVPMNLRVPAAFHRRVKQFALDNNVSVKAATIKALEELMDRAGTPK